MTYNFSQFRGRVVAVTGASGFTGGHLTDRLLSLGAKPKLLLRASSNPLVEQRFSEQGAVIVRGDLCDRAAAEELCANADIVFHVAALFRAAKFPDSEYFRVNRDGTRILAEAASNAGVSRFIHCSTNGVHGTVDHPPANEDAPLRPMDVYQVSKVEAEQVVQGMVASGRLQACILRPAMIWGEADRRFQKMFRAIKHRRFPIIGTGKTLCHWLYVHDLVDAFLLAADAADVNGRVYLIAGKAPVTLEHTVQEIAACAGVHPLPFKIPAPPLQIAGGIIEKLCVPFGVEPPLHRRRVDFFVKNRAFDISRAKKDLGYQPQLSFAEETKRIYTWYNEHGWLE